MQEAIESKVKSIEIAKSSVCGIVMPISALDNCTEEHWADVLSIVSDAIQNADFEANLVSSAEEIGVIQKRIIQNLYENPIVVCDVSGKNPNVMFELGLRLAFDKPTIIMKDDKTSYSFDTAPIEHITYPRDLRFAEIVRFKAKLTEKIQNTVRKAKSDKEFTTFLGHFGTFKVAKIEEKIVPGSELILDQLSEIRTSINSMRHNFRGDRRFERGFMEIDDALKDGTTLSDFSRIAKRSIRKYCKEKNVQILQLKDNFESLLDFVEEDSGAPRRFQNKDQFRSFLKVMVATL